MNNINNMNNMNNINNTDNITRPEINKNYSFVKNNETYNKKLFDRNFLMSELSQSAHTTPTYFNELHNENRKDAEELFNKRFANLRSEPMSSGKMGYVNFNDVVNKSPNNITGLDFSGKYSEYLDESRGLDDHNSSVKRTEHKR
jgi:hypothetical protein